MVFSFQVSIFTWSLLTEGIGILGRWRDGTESPGTGVTGPFWLWRAPESEPMDLDEDSDDSDSDSVDTDEEVDSE